jgi:hypothetical protein
MNIDSKAKLMDVKHHVRNVRYKVPNVKENIRKQVQSGWEDCNIPTGNRKDSVQNLVLQ